MNPGALVAEIKDLQGNTKSTVSGKQQNFELEPGDTVSFIINDDPKWYSNNAGKLTIGYSTNPITLNSLKPTPLVAIADLYNTGVDNDRKVLGDSISDPHYTLATYPAGTVTPGVTTPNKDLAPINWVANTQTARWIGPNTTSATGPVGDYSYKTTFTLPSFAEALIVGELSVDDWITDILINGVSEGNPVPLSSWTNIRKFSISKGFVVGTNTIEFKLHSVGGPTGLRIDSISGTYKQGLLSTGNKIKLKSWKGDYLHRPDSDQGVTSWNTGVGNEWTVEVIPGNKIKLKSWKGDYLHRPDSDQGVTSWSTGVGNEWTVEAIAGNKIKLKSWKGDYLHRPDSQQGVTSWSTGVGNEWEVELVQKISTEQLLSQKWVQVPNSGSVIGVTVMKDGTILGIGMDKYLWTRATLNSSWVQVPNSGSVIGVTVMQDGTILGIGTDNYLWTRATLNSSWVQVPNSGAVIGVTVMQDGTILGIGTDNYLWTKGI